MPEPADGAALLDHAARWRRVSGELDAAVAVTAALAAEIAGSWTDRSGQGWAQRLGLVARELDRQAGVAADIVRLVTALADGAGGPDPSVGAPEVGPVATDPPITDRGHTDGGHTDRGNADRGYTDRGHTSPGSGWAQQGAAGEATDPSWTLPGVRLGGTDGSRASERRGVVVPALPDQPAG